jgi:CubicO group peptidase (beta-lactamase class C family)
MNKLAALTLSLSLSLPLGLGLLNSANAAPLPLASPIEGGFSAEGLDRLDRFFAREIEANRVPGAVVAIARDGKLIHYKAYGYLDRSNNTPMPIDAVFGLASMTKIMTSVAALQLNEQGPSSSPLLGGCPRSCR